MNKVRENIYEFSQVSTIKIHMVVLASQTGHRVSLYLNTRSPNFVSCKKFFFGNNSILKQKTAD